VFHAIDYWPADMENCSIVHNGGSLWMVEVPVKKKVGKGLEQVREVVRGRHYALRAEHRQPRRRIDRGLRG
jgi:hypothetical protein